MMESARNPAPISNDPVRPKAIVIGGTSGLGQTVCPALMNAGWSVEFTYCHAEAAAHALQATLEPLGSVMAHRLDVTDPQAVASYWQTLDSPDPPQALVYLAGTSHDAYLSQMSAMAWHEALDVHLTGFFYCLQTASRLMSRRRYGRVVAVSSDAALMGVPMRANYCAAKAGLLGLVKSAARELAPLGVTVNAIAPGMIRTPRIEGWPADTLARLRESIPMRRLGEPDEVAALIAFLCSESAGYLTGQVISIDGGLRM